jgi:hypothetical protein
MIDFRYHLISLIAVILALALGIVAGSGFIGGPLLNRLEREVDDLRESNDERLARIAELEGDIDQSETFARLVGDYLVGGALEDSRVVVFQFDDSDGDLVDGVKRALLDAGAEISSEITLSQKFALSTQPTVDELALILGSVETRPETLRAETAAILGDRSASAAVETQGDQPSSGAAAERLAALLDSLESAGFVGVEMPGDGPAVPPDASFVVIGGDETAGEYEPGSFTVGLVEALADRGAPAVVAESRTSSWELVVAIRQDVEARGLATTVDNAETTIGRIATVLGLAQAQNGRIGHFGFGTGRTAVIPAPSNP